MHCFQLVTFQLSVLYPHGSLRMLLHMAHSRDNLSVYARNASRCLSHSVNLRDEAIRAHGVTRES